MKQLILASNSPRRKEILLNMGFKVKIIPSSFNETESKYTNPVRLVRYLAEAKAKKVGELHKGIILGFDTIVVKDETIIGKPSDNEDAIRILNILSGSRHLVITGFCILDSSLKKSVVSYDCTTILFRGLSQQEINNYVKHYNVLDKAGAYGIQSTAYNFISQIEGDYYNVMGLPIQKFVKLFLNFTKKL